MEIILGCLLFSAMIMGTTATVARVITDGITTARASKAGAWDFLESDRARRDAKAAGRRDAVKAAWAATRQRRHKQAGGTGQYKPGLRAYAGDVYTGWWADRLANRQAKRDHRGPVTWSPDRKPWHVRLDETVAKGAGRARQAWRDRGNQPANTQAEPESPDSQPDEPVAVGPRIACPDCGATLTRAGSNWGACGNCSWEPAPDAPADAASPSTRTKPLHLEDPTRQPATAEGEPVTTSQPWKPRYSRSNDVLEEQYQAYGVKGSLTETMQRKVTERQAADTNTNGGNTMSDTTTISGSGATGDCHDVETAIHECGALDDDLTAINTALDVIDEKIDSAGSAAERIAGFLTSKSVDDAAVGGMSVAQDMLSPTHIKALMDAVAAAKQGVAAASAELTRLQELESQLNGADGSVLNGR